MLQWWQQAGYWFWLWTSRHMAMAKRMGEGGYSHRQAYQVSSKISFAEMDYFNEKKYEEGKVIRRRKTEGKEKGEIEIYVEVVGVEVSGITYFIKELTILEYLRGKKKEEKIV